ncbi:MAG: PAS domain S-box protein [Chloroflexi bacterium]|nr:PAS domain S-box protein [Anaerolineaceae bacterium]NMB87866.1 PAS domain S-box protein [Chloroflexota bacterium]
MLDRGDLSTVEARGDFSLLFNSLVAEVEMMVEGLKTVQDELRQQNNELAAVQSILAGEHNRYQSLFNFAPDGYLVTDLNGSIQEANQVAADLFTVPAAALKGTRLINYVAIEDRSFFRKRLQQVTHANHSVGQGSLEWEFRLIPRRGIPIDASGRVSLAPGIAHGEQTLRWLIRDITVYKQMQLSLRENESKFRSLTETVSAGIFILREGRIRFTNPAASIISGYRQEELFNKPFQYILHQESLEVFQQEIEQDRWLASRYDQTARSYQLRLLSKNRRECWVDATTGSIQFEHEPAMIITIYDITQRERSERERKDLLHRLVGMQEDERKRISLELHDQMGQSLTALLLGFESLKHDVDHNNEARGKIEKLQRLTNELGRSIHELSLDLHPSALEDLGLNKALYNYIEEWSERSRVEVDMQTNLEYPEGLPQTLSTTIYRIVLEALTNIARHANAKRVSVILDRRSSHMLTIIEDDGCGFEVDEVLSQSSGRHLGLVGMKERAEMVGGKFTIETMPGKGTTIFLRIPLRGPAYE